MSAVVNCRLSITANDEFRMPPEILFQILVLLFAGLVAGFLAGLFGVGGG